MMRDWTLPPTETSCSHSSGKVVWVICRMGHASRNNGWVTFLDDGIVDAIRKSEEATVDGSHEPERG